jgi:hypothetical protein
MQLAYLWAKQDGAPQDRLDLMLEWMAACKDEIQRQQAPAPAPAPVPALPPGTPQPVPAPNPAPGPLPAPGPAPLLS